MKRRKKQTEEDDWRTAATKMYKEKSRGNRFKLSEGDNSIRILPGVNSNGKIGGPPWYEYFAHRDVGPSERFIACGKDARGQGKCWLCDKQIPKLKKSKSKSTRVRASGMEPVSQFVVQVAYLDSSGDFQGPVQWTVPSGGRRSLATQLLGVLVRTKKNYMSLKLGYNLNIERTGTGRRDTRYGAIIPDEDSSRVPKEIGRSLKPLSELIEAYSEDKMQAAFFGRESEVDDEDAEEEDTEDAEDDDEDTDEDDEDTDEARKTTTKTLKTTTKTPTTTPRKTTTKTTTKTLKTTTTKTLKTTTKTPTTTAKTPRKKTTTKTPKTTTKTPKTTTKTPKTTTVKPLRSLVICSVKTKKTRSPKSNANRPRSPPRSPPRSQPRKERLQPRKRKLQRRSPRKS